MVKKNILIVGYPKSGTTWLSRLVAELIKCPIQGDWGFNNASSLYKEGEDRVSSFQCYKSHHTFNELHNASNQNIYKIIYIIRDPRDIVISGAHYFLFSHPLILFLKKINLPFGIYFLKKAYTFFLKKKKKKRIMIKAVLFGDYKINEWLKTPWKDHYQGYSNNNILFIHYENALNHTESVSKKIMDYLEIPVKHSHIKESVKKHSFNIQKQKINAQSNSPLKKLVRKGTYGYWKNDFTEKEKELFKNTLKQTDFYTF